MTLDDQALLAPPPISALVLVDFDNLYHRAPEDISVEQLRHDIISVSTAIVRRAIGTNALRFRFYGGWKQGGVLTSAGSAAAAILGAADPFPMVHPNQPGLLRGTLDLATSLVGNPDFDFGDTLRSRVGLPRARLASPGLPVGCAGGEPSCPARILRRFSRSIGSTCPVDGCPVTNGVAFVRQEQKMVDSLISCDLIEGTRGAADGMVVLLSEDSDFLPTLAYCSGPVARLLVGPERFWRESFGEMLDLMTVSLLEWHP